MTAEELRALFNAHDGLLYRVAMRKSELEMMSDAGQSIATFACPAGYFIKVDQEFSHADYTKVE